MENNFKDIKEDKTLYKIVYDFETNNGNSHVELLIIIVLLLIIVLGGYFIAYILVNK